MTRAAQRILDRARTSAWRRVGIPERWPDAPNGKKSPDAVRPDQETDRAKDPTPDVTPDRDET